MSVGGGHATGTDIALKGGSHLAWLWEPNNLRQPRTPGDFVLSPERVLEERALPGQRFWPCLTVLRPTEVGHRCDMSSEKNSGPAFYPLLSPFTYSTQPSCLFRKIPLLPAASSHLPRGVRASHPGRPIFQWNTLRGHPNVEPRLASFLSQPELLPTLGLLSPVQFCPVLANSVRALSFL